MPIDLLDRGPEYDPDNSDEVSQVFKTGDTGLGTGTIINALNGLTNKSSNNIFDVIVVNIATLIRNNLSKERTDKEVVELVKNDLHDLIRAVGSYHENMGGLVRNPTMINYLPDYSYLPAINARPNTGNRKRIADITEGFIRDDDLRRRTRIRDHERGTTIYEVYAGGRVMLPYKSIMREIADIFRLGNVDPRASLTSYLLISHAPLDYHMLLNYPRVTLLESFTGRFLKPKELGHKVFGTNFIPFNAVTHLLFGDSVHVDPFAKRKNKQLLTDMAKTQSWYVRTKEEIAKLVGASGQVPAEILLRVKL